MVNNRCVTLNNPVHGEVTSVTSIGYLSVLEYFDGSFYSVDRRATIVQDVHADLGGAARC
jgi:hypothetical protein